MLKFAAKRFAYSLIVVLIASFILFWAVRETFDPLAKVRLSHDPGAIARETKRLGLDQSIVAQYFTWLGRFLTGDWGVSSATNEPVFSVIGRALGTTAQLLLWGLLLAVLVAGAVGVYSAIRQYSIGDVALTGLSYLGLAMPPFWFGLVLIAVVSLAPQQLFGWQEPPFFFVGLHSPDSSGIGLDYFRHLVLPVLTFTAQLIGNWSRYLRSSMLGTLRSDYVRTARAKGVPRRQVILRHAVRNSLGPFITVVALDAGLLFGGLVVTEQVFAVDGMGRLFFSSIQAGDAFVLVPWMVVVALAVILFNLLADFSYAWLDPRVRLR
ncbi:ABC transporter permease [Sciscionella sediminilitoris]|uniref:ABC transporter permease n=1 Tax=Sciscionella sediminilitoris TaxID=1445613 RepID=UPI0004DFC2C6|nr:ABC transporter permease [Sciscionella sp. SE31]